jgi:hypothetical protein
VHAPDRADGIAGFALLDGAFADATDPDRVIVEITNDFLDRRGRLLEDGAVIGRCHGETPSPLDAMGSSMAIGGPGAHPIPDNPAAAKRLKFRAKPPLKEPNFSRLETGLC